MKHTVKTIKLSTPLLAAIAHNNNNAIKRGLLAPANSLCVITLIRFSDDTRAILRGGKNISQSRAQKCAGRWIPVIENANSFASNNIFAPYAGRYFFLDDITKSAAERASVRKGSLCVVSKKQLSFKMIFDWRVAPTIESASVSCGSECVSLVRDGDNWLFKYCVACGKLEKQESSACRRNRVFCQFCGAELHTKQEKEAHKCAGCRGKCVNKLRSYHDWHECPRFTNKDKRQSILHFGYELELHASHSGDGAIAAESIGETVNKNAFLPYLHFEEDGSLDYRGCECISEPCTLAAHAARMADLQKALDEAKGEGLIYVNQRAGLHIHVDRNFFGDTHRDASLRFAYLISVFQHDLDQITGRNGNREYNNPSGILRSDEPLQAWSKVSAQGHSAAVNIGGVSTIELRIFASTLDTKKLLALLDLTQAIAIYTKKSKYDRLARAQFTSLARYIRYQETIKTLAENGLSATKASDMLKVWQRAHKRNEKKEVK